MNQYHDEPTFEPGKSPVTHTPSPQFPHPINARYRCIGLLGHGSSGAVYRAYDQQLQRDVAIKFIHQQNISERRRLLAEARLLAQLEHPNVCKVYEVVEEGDAVYLVMSFVDGTHLGQWSHRFTTANTVKLIAQVADALASAHAKGIVHCDVKPHNIVLKDTLDGAMDAVLVDFGVAHSSTAFNSHTSGGTRMYMAPERFSDSLASLKPAADIYGLGATLLFLLTGQPDPKALTDHELPDDLRRIILKCTETSPNERYADIGMLRDDLRAWLATRPISLRRSPLYNAKKGWQRNRWVRGTSLAAAVLLVVLATGGAIYQDAMHQRQFEQLEIRDQVAHTEAQIEAIYRSPVHNTRAELERLYQQALQWRVDANNQPDWLAAASNAAAGRIFYQLNETEKALAALTDAWELGDRSGLTAMALAQVYQRLYTVAQAQARNHASRASRERALTQAHEEFQQPALSYLNQAEDNRLPPAYVDAMRAFLEGDEAAALNILSNEDFPVWFYQRYQFITDILRARLFDTVHGRAEAPVAEVVEQLEGAYHELTTRLPSYFEAYQQLASVYNELESVSKVTSDNPQMRENLERMNQLDPTHPRGYHLNALIHRHASHAESLVDGTQLAYFRTALRNHELALKEAAARDWPKQLRVRLLMSTLDTLRQFRDNLKNTGKPYSSVMHRYFTVAEQIPEAHRGAKYHMSLGLAHYAMAAEYDFDQRAHEHLQAGNEAFLKAREIAPTIAGMHGNHARSINAAVFYQPRPEAYTLLQEAIQAIDTTHSLLPDNAAVAYNRGRVYLSMAENAPLGSTEAKEAIQVAHDSFVYSLELFPDLDFARDQLADIYHFHGELLEQPLSLSEALSRSAEVLQLDRSPLPDLTLQRQADVLRFSIELVSPEQLPAIAADLESIAETLRERESYHSYPIFVNSLYAAAEKMPEPIRTNLTTLARELFAQVANESSNKASFRTLPLHARASFAEWYLAREQGGLANNELQRLEDLCALSQTLLKEDSFDKRRLWDLQQAWQTSDKLTGLDCSGSLNTEFAKTL